MYHQPLYMVITMAGGLMKIQNQKILELALDCVPSVKLRNKASGL
jgi:hypothetical protein